MKRTATSAGLLAIVALLATGCTARQTVHRDAPVAAPAAGPIASLGAGDMLGYAVHINDVALAAATSDAELELPRTDLEFIDLDASTRIADVPLGD